MNSDQVIRHFRQNALPLPVRGDISVAVCRGAARHVRCRMKVHPVRPELEVIVSKRLLPRGTPVGSSALNIEIEARTGVWQRVSEMRGGVDCGGAIKMVVPHGVTAYPGDIAGERAVNHSSGRCTRSRRGGDPRKAPSRRAVPEILDTGIVVEVNTID